MLLELLLLMFAAAEGVDVDVHSHVSVSVDCCNTTSTVVHQNGNNNLTGDCCCDEILEKLDALERLNRTRCCHEHPRDCMDYLNRGYTESGIFTIMVSSAIVEVYCDMETDGGGWMVFQRRARGDLENFNNRGWFAYRDGFGDLSSSFWWGNKYLSLAFRDGRQYELRVDMTDWDDVHKYAKYGQFHVGEPIDEYRMTVIEYQGTAGDSLARQSGSRFTTHDNDNDAYSGNCADLYNGGFWFDSCFVGNLNGPYSTTSAVPYAQGVVWRTFHDSYYYSLREADMKFRAVIA